MSSADTVATGTMGEQRGIPMLLKLHWIDIHLIVLGKFVHQSPDYLRVVFLSFGRAFLYKLK